MTIPAAKRRVKPDWRRSAIEVSAAAGLAALVWLYGSGASIDDLFIYLRYADNLRQGHGLVYNTGEVSAGVTSLAWLVLASTVSLLFGNVETVWKLLGIGLVFAGLVVLLRALRFLPLTAALSLAALTLLDPFALRWAATGMDGALAYCASIVFFVLFHRFVAMPSMPHARMLCAVAVVLPFVRPELAVVSATASVFVAFTNRYAYLSLVLIETGVFAGLLLASWRWTGFLLPQTGAAKALMLAHPDPLYAVSTFLGIAAVAIPGAVVAIGGAWRSSRRLAPLFATAVLLFASMLAYFIATNTLVSTRYSTLYSAPLLCCAAFVLAERFVALGRWSMLARTAFIVQIAVCLPALAWMLPATRTDEASQIRPIGEWAREHLPADAVVAIHDLGAFGYFYGRRVVDLTGLVSPEVVVYARAHGSLRSAAELAPFLSRAGVTHFIDTGPGDRSMGEDEDGKKFTPLRQWSIVRNNLSAGRERPPDIWRLYAFRASQ